MITLRKLIFPALGVLAVAIVACGGGGGAGSPAIPKAAPTAAARAPVAIKIVIGSAPANAPARIKRRMAEAASTNGLQIVVYPSPSSSPNTPVLTQAFDTSAATGGCPTNADGSRTCTGTLALQPGTYTVVVTSYDQPPVSGAIPGTAHPLGYQMLVQTIVAGGPNAIGLSLDGIATGVSVTLPVPIVHTTNALTQQAAVVALDAANDAIVANSYVDVNGNPVSINIVSGNTALVVVSPAPVSSASANGVGVSYSPAGLTAADMSGGTSVSITASVVGGGSGSATLTVPAAMQSVNIHGPAVGISVQGASTLWLAEPVGYLQSVTLGAPVTAQSPDPVATVSGLVGMSPAPDDVVYNSGDSYLYFTMSNNAVLGRLPTTGAQFQEGGVSLSANGVSVSTDGTNIWTIEPTTNKLAWVQASTFSFSNEFPATTPSSGLSQIVFGTSGDMWYSESAVNQIGAAAAASPGPIAEVALTTAGSVPNGIAWDGSTTMWVAESNASKIATVVGSPLSATVTEYPVGSSVHPLNIVVGPDFGNVWFDYSSPTAGIGRITPAGVVSFYPLPVGASPGRMATAGGMIWVTDSANSTIYGVTP